MKSHVCRVHMRHISYETPLIGGGLKSRYLLSRASLSMKAVSPFGDKQQVVLQMCRTDVNKLQLRIPEIRNIKL